MTCLDVMYQSPYQPYQAYPFYQHHHLATQKFGHYKMHEPLDPVDYAGAVLTQHQPLPTLSAPPVTPTPSTPQQTAKAKEEDESDSDKEPTPEAEYISSRCVLFSYFTGDIGKHVDSHFSRALSQPSSCTATDSNVKNSISSDWKTGDLSPMNQRNFPPSFWNSAYTSQSHHDTLSFRDPYPAAYTSSYSSLHQSADPWHYSLSTQSSYSAAAHRSIHDLGYNMASASPFNTRYSSLLIQPSVRTGRLGQCDLAKPADSWTSRYVDPISSESLPGLGVDAPAALDHQEQSSKDLYWF